MVSKLAEGDEDTRQTEKRVVVGELPLVAHREAAEAQQPPDGAFDDPAATVAPQLAAILKAVAAMAEMGHDQVDPAGAEALPERATIVAAIGNYALGFLLRPARARPRDRHLGEGRFGEVDFGSLGRRKVHAERNTRAVDQYHKLCPLTFTCEADASAPFFAGAKVASRKASLQSSWPRSSRSLRKARHRVSQTSWRSHSARRRQHVAGLGYRSGRSRHRAPVRSTQRMPSKQARSSARGRPPRGLRFGLGRNGAIFAHCASVRNGAMTPSSDQVDQNTVERGF